MKKDEKKIKKVLRRARNLSSCAYRQRDKPNQTKKMTTKYVIRETCNFYGPKTVRSLVIGDNHRPLIFNTASDARAYIAEMQSEVYHLTHNEYARPAYKVLNIANLPAYLANRL